MTKRCFIFLRLDLDCSLVLWAFAFFLRLPVNDFFSACVSFYILVLCFHSDHSVLPKCLSSTSFLKFFEVPSVYFLLYFLFVLHLRIPYFVSLLYFRLCLSRTSFSTISSCYFLPRNVDFVLIVCYCNFFYFL